MRSLASLTAVLAFAWACGESLDSPTLDAAATGDGGGTVAPDSAGQGIAPDGGSSAPSDGQAPSIVIDSAPPAQQDDSTGATFVFTATGIPSVECRLDEGAFTPCTSPTTYEALGKGVHTFEVRAGGGAYLPSANHRWIVFAPTAKKWFAPMPFVTGRTVRPDFAALATSGDAWAQVRARADVFKSYLMILPDDSGVDLDALVKMVNEAGLRTAFEVGGLRLYTPGTCAVGMLGNSTADVEIAFLQRWAAANGGTGRIDYITADHAIAGVIEQGLLGNCSLTPAQSAVELAVYFERIQVAFPKAKVGLIESLGYWDIAGPNGTHYTKTRADLPTVTLDSVLTAVVAAATAQGVTVDHFDIDYGAEGPRVDYARLLLQGGTGLVTNAHDYGRIAAAQQIAAQKGLVAGVIYNAFHDDGNGGVYPTITTYATEPERIAASQSARARTVEFFGEYQTLAVAQDKYVFQFWHPFPHLTGPDSTPTTGTGVIADLLALVP